METTANILIIVFISIGVIFSVVTALGLIRLPDVYTRTHAAAKSSTLGALTVLTGTFFHYWLLENHFNTQLLLAITFLFLTSPVAGHLIGRSAYMSGVKLTEETVRDDLKIAIERKKFADKRKKEAEELD